VQSVVIRNGVSFQDGYIETSTDSVADGGLVRRFQSSVGNVLNAYDDGTVVATVTDNTYSSGGIGLRADNTRGWTTVTSRFDNFLWLLH
jgi:hypothetical protein